MAVKKPLALYGGEIAQLQTGDTLETPGTNVDIVSLTNGDVGAHAVGDVVYISAASEAKKAKADAGATKGAIAFATAAIASAASGTYQTDGILAGLAGLTAGAVYFLSAATAGAMTTTAPSTTGQYVVRLGTAISATELEIQIEPPILL